MQGLPYSWYLLEQNYVSSEVCHAFHQWLNDIASMLDGMIVENEKSVSKMAAAKSKAGIL